MGRLEKNQYNMVQMNGKTIQIIVPAILLSETLKIAEIYIKQN